MGERDSLTATENELCLGLSGVLDYQDCLNSGCFPATVAWKGLSRCPLFHIG